MVLRDAHFFAVTPRPGHEPIVNTMTRLPGRMRATSRASVEVAGLRQSFTFERSLTTPGGLVVHLFTNGARQIALDNAIWEMLLQAWSEESGQRASAPTQSPAAAVAETVASQFIPILVDIHNRLERHATGAEPLSTEEARRLSEWAADILHQLLADVTGTTPPDFQQPPEAV